MQKKIRNYIMVFVITISVISIGILSIILSRSGSLGTKELSPKAGCVPTCAWRYCGADDDCGGICNNCEGSDPCTCGGGKVCQAGAGTCGCSCKDKTCKTGTDGCGNICQTCTGADACKCSALETCNSSTNLCELKSPTTTTTSTTSSSTTSTTLKVCSCAMKTCGDNDTCGKPCTYCEVNPGGSNACKCPTGQTCSASHSCSATPTTTTTTLKPAPTTTSTSSTSTTTTSTTSTSSSTSNTSLTTTTTNPNPGVYVTDIAPVSAPDGKTDILDLSLVLANWDWKKNPKDPPADINKDGLVDIVDVSLILSHWTK